jgi:transcriptional regulator with XRE-family HTH domain
LSKIENNRLSPTYDTIVKLARGLNVNVEKLFSDAPPKEPIGRRSVTRRGPILGAVVFGLLSETLRLHFSQYYMILLGVLLILSVLYIPNGLASIERPNWLRMPRRAEDRHA